MAETKLITKQIIAMEMPFSVKFVVAGDQNFHATLTVQKVTRYLQHIDQDFSPFKATSLVCQFQRGELAAADCTAEFQEVYGLVMRAQEATAGGFDPFFRGQFDPTGIVKGWAIQNAFTRYLQPLLTNETLVAAAINGAGDIQTGVSAMTTFRWQVGVEDPSDRQQLLTGFQLGNGAMATSGTSRHGEHIVRQDVQRTLQQATIIARDLITADIWATAAMSMGPIAFNRLTAGRLQSILVDQSNQIVGEEQPC
ncbi:FAD:protein FMN transferase [Levilactobacillus fujinensis]|uniref:FAD:protein FMN transferase n=1 Tax=Levilactobacillus fujinensis TaxID=2486024 RepID=A0ABW1TFY3_9LACO|nr:FAD:protein FMN transferase [Levilactobacillus fujinensis]